MEEVKSKATSRAFVMTALNSRLQLALISRKKKQDILQQGFTLVELMVVIVIVAILSAVALPNFLKQTDKAKATEGKTSIAAILKQAQAGFIENGAAPKTAIADMITDYGAAANDTQKFNYSATWNGTTNLYTVLATANSKDLQIKDKLLYGCVDMDTGVIEISQNLLASTTTAADVDCVL